MPHVGKIPISFSSLSSRLKHELLEVEHLLTNGAGDANELLERWKQLSLQIEAGLKPQNSVHKIRSGSVIVEDLLPDAAPGKLQMENASAEIRRVVKRLSALLVLHFKSASRLGVDLGPDDIRAVSMVCWSKPMG